MIIVECISTTLQCALKRMPMVPGAHFGVAELHAREVLQSLLGKEAVGDRYNKPR